MAKRYSKLTCCRCGAKFDYADACEQFEEAYPNASYELEFYSGNDYYCGECACNIYGSNYDEDYQPPYACDGCGNPAYPLCMTGCSMFDD